MFQHHLKILTVCAGGNVRSVTLARLLKYYEPYQQPNTLAAGIWILPSETFDMLAEWADLILVCGEEALWERLPAKYHTKSYLVSIGIDQWDQAYAENLMIILKDRLDTDVNLRQRLGWQ